MLQGVAVTSAGKEEAHSFSQELLFEKDQAAPQDGPVQTLVGGPPPGLGVGDHGTTS